MGKCLSASIRWFLPSSKIVWTTLGMGTRRGEGKKDTNEAQSCEINSKSNIVHKFVSVHYDIL